MGNHNGFPVVQKKSGYFSFNRIPIRLKITLPYLLLVVVFSFGVATLASKIILETVDERFINQLYEVGKIASESVVKEESRMLGTLRLLSYMEGVAETIEKGDANHLRWLTLGTVINNQEESVIFLNADRLLVLSLQHKKGGNLEEYYSSNGGEAFADWEIVKKVSSGGSDALGDKFVDHVKTDLGNFLVIAGPVLNEENQITGIIIIGKSLDSLARQIREDTLAQVTIYTPDGKPLASTFTDPAVIDRVIVEKVIINQDTSSFRRDSPLREFESLKMGYGEILGPWEVRGDVDLGILGVSLVKNTLITASMPTRIQITVLITLTVFIILIVGINLARLITQPLLRLVKASQVVADGNLQIQVPVSSHDEIADLAISFNQMIDSLQQSKKDLIDSYDKTLSGWSKALELRDHETQGHSKRVTDLTLALAEKLGIDGEEKIHIRHGAILHDIGKMGIPDAILRKPGPLTDTEREIMRNHPVYACDMLEGIEYLKPALDIPYCHHEKWDGTGYPRGLRELEIPLAARLFAIVDVWDALTSDRPYRKHMTPLEAVKIIREGSGKHFDPALVKLFLEYCVEQNLLPVDQMNQQVLASSPAFVSVN